VATVPPTTHSHTFVIKLFPFPVSSCTDLEGPVVLSARLLALGGLFVDLVVVVGLCLAAVGSDADRCEEEGEHEDDDEEVLRVGQLGVGDARDAQRRDDHTEHLK
jgi:hypothetical protein